MRLGGLHKTSMLDFPGKVSTVVFTQGCNFICPYCHNPDLVLYRQAPLELTGVIAFLAKRRKILEGVVISGGEPTLQENLFSFCATLKSLGYAVKLDTNGSKPEVLQGLLLANLVDYVAMDVKADPEAYPLEICSKEISKGISRSMELLEDSQVQHEFRIPCASPFINETSFAAILRQISRAPIFLQSLRLENILQRDFFAKQDSTGLSIGQGQALGKDMLEKLLTMAQRKGLNCHIR